MRFTVSSSALSSKLNMLAKVIEARIRCQSSIVSFSKLLTVK